MKISYNWLQSHFDKPLPKPLEISKALIFHSFEVEGLEEIAGDYVFDIKILPDRAHDCLCHFGIAREVSAVLDIEKPKHLFDINIGKKSDDSIRIDNNSPELCPRYMARVIRGVTVKESPTWLKERLSAIGQRSINNIVDSANFAMFEVGQPLHAFDMDKIKGGISIRKALPGEKIVTLDDKEVILNENILVIADEEGPLAIAGIKGGKRAGVTSETSSIVLESANFSATNIRRGSASLSLHTDASKRFENGISPILAKFGLDYFTRMIMELSSNTDMEVGQEIDIYETVEKERAFIATLADINSILGIEISKDKVFNILERLGMKVSVTGDTLEVVPPQERLELNTKEDLSEEVGRIYGYENIPSIVPEKIGEIVQNTKYVFSNKIREILKDKGFSEIYGYSFTDKGEIEVMNAIASDKSFLRKDLTFLVSEKIELNLKNIIFDNEPVKIFEIGTVFEKEGESTRLVLGIGYKTKKLNKGKEKLEKEILPSLWKELNISKELVPIKSDIKDNFTIFEFNLEDIINASEKVPSFVANKIINKNASYKTISLYPRIIRDVAVFVPTNITPEHVGVIIEKNAGPLLQGKPILFDVFEKKDEAGNVIKKSIAFRLIFQSYERTLQDEEINDIMTKIINVLNGGSGYEIR
ncbi:MAG: Phenylalanine-tRNA ligase beta subunit [Parcubacteria group bacterium GW2011_GWF2_38_76]|nr:MAG: Phenylalanine-tRNA ligase beta subunit [Parcubacteria group bacterium GW2011_GWF2_38_76]HBM45498.1 hypothetical protein [Patescibacteria group bacterium]